MTIKDKVKENETAITYCYVIDKNDYKIKRPNSFVYPKIYPCVVESNKSGFFVSSRFIYDLTDFIYEDGVLYKNVNS